MGVRVSVTLCVKGCRAAVDTELLFAMLARTWDIEVYNGDTLDWRFVSLRS